MRRLFLGVCALLMFSGQSQAQVDEDQLGAWYMYFWTADLENSRWGFQGDIQYRNWDVIGDLEQLLLRGAVTYRPKDTNVKLALGYANITTGAFGDNSSTVNESRIYQEALLPQKVGGRLYFTHRFRYEQRFNEGQDFRTRFRYGLFLNIPLSGKEIVAKTWYLGFYNELFINGERNIGDGRRVSTFDRNRLFGSLGYAIKSNLKIQLGAMRQITNNVDKTQLQLGVFHSF
ncbi:DUF2490 domain-containing protein [Gilvibacter sp.]|uniref:DUF2490 domain-containing protein n=1 Tax=Gilvibacter sp. TaxID=2729997 RepID=UPI003B52340E